MTKVHPNGAAAASAAPAVAPAAVAEENGEAVSLTVWRRSLLFNGKGFTVFDCKGNLVYRVETYGGGSPREVVLMDADGHGLLTIRHKVLLKFLTSVSSIREDFMAGYWIRISWEEEPLIDLVSVS